MIERRRFVYAAEQKRVPFAELCRLFGISRKNGYKWVGRAHDGEELDDHSRRPHSNSRAISPKVERRLVRLRKQHPTWGARKLIAWLTTNEPKWELPAASTVTDVLKRNALIEAPFRRQKVPSRTTPLAHATHPNALWTIDFKGQFLVGSGDYCFPLTVMDAHSRVLLCCKSLTSAHYEPVRRWLERVFREWGLPERMRSDNGPPFGVMRIAPLSRLSVWLVKLGVLPEYITPGCPQQNGRHERFHLTLKKETAMPPAKSLAAQQRRFDLFRREYNDERPHEALGNCTPLSVHRRAPNNFPSKIKDPEYPGHYEVRRISEGRFRWHDVNVGISHTLNGERVGLVEVDTGRWEIYFGPLLVAQLHEALPELGAPKHLFKTSPMSPV